MNNFKNNAIESLRYLAFCLAFSGIVIGACTALSIIALVFISAFHFFGACLGLVIDCILLYALVFLCLFFSNK